MIRNWRCTKNIMTCLFIFIIVSAFSSTVLAQNDAECQALLEQAQQKHIEGYFDESIELVKKCLQKSGISASVESAAYKQLSESLLAKDYKAQAKIAIKQLLELSPNYKPRLNEDPPEFVEMVEEVRHEMVQSNTETPSESVEKSGGGTNWLLIGGGVAVAGVAAAVLLGGGSGGGGDDPLGEFPLPPVRPGN